MSDVCRAILEWAAPHIAEIRQHRRLEGATLVAAIAALGMAVGWTVGHAAGRRREEDWCGREVQPPAQLAPCEAAPGRASQLRALLAQGRLVLMPCVYDALTAKLVERAGFELTFMTGFGVSAARGYPDCQLVSFQEMVDAAFSICGSLEKISCIGDGDTGYGNCINVKRTVRAYAQAGLAGIMIEDQIAPKRCGHTQGKAVISREEAIARIRAACDARDEASIDICILARTDARATDGLDEAIERCKAFVEAGADITFLEAPHSEEEMARYCREVSGPKLANMLPSGTTPMLSPKRLEELGFTLAAYPLTLLSASMKAQIAVLKKLRSGEDTSLLELDFGTLKEVLGFNAYFAEEMRYQTN